MSGPDVDPELSALEESLGRLQPRAELSREAVLFEAGRAAAPRGRLWPALAGVSTVAAARSRNISRRSASKVIPSASTITGTSVARTPASSADASSSVPMPGPITHDCTRSCPGSASS